MSDHATKAATPLPCPVQTYTENTLPEYASTDLDPYMDPCPLWCSNAADGHRVESNDEDRNHYGDDAAVPLRDVAFDYTPGERPQEPTTFSAEGVVMYLRRNALERDARISFRIGRDTRGPSLTLDEAESIGRALLAMVESAR